MQKNASSRKNPFCVETLNPLVNIERCAIRRKVLTEYIKEQYEFIKDSSDKKGIQRVGSEQASVALKVCCTNWGSWFQLWNWREDICGKGWRVKMRVDLL